ncbi:hypothetical protein BH24ACT19_BH24ACT19_21960 [soil metagenome]
MSEKDFSRGRPEDPGEDERRVRSVKSFLGLIACVLGILFAVAGFVSLFVAGPAIAASISLQAIGAVLGIVGYFLGVRRLAVAAIVLCVLSFLFGLAASQGLIPGFEGQDRGIPDQEPGAQE